MPSCPVWNKKLQELMARCVVTRTTKCIGRALHTSSAVSAFFIAEDLENPNPIICMKNIAETKNITQGYITHARLIQTGYEFGVSIQNALLNMYEKCGKNEHVLKVFNQMQHKDSTSYGIAICTYARSDCHRQQILDLYNEALPTVRKCTEKEIHFYHKVLRAIAGFLTLEKSNEIHGELKERGLINRDGFIGYCVVNMYLKLGEHDKARQVFDEIPTKTVYAWDAMISAYARRGDMEEAFRLFGKNNDKTVVSWNAVISGFVKKKMYARALVMFRWMQRSKMEFNERSFVSALGACAGAMDLDTGREIHDMVCQSNFMGNVIVASAVIDMYVKCGCVRDARQVFDKMSRRNVITWNTMVSGYLVNGEVDMACQVFDKMPVRNFVSWTALIAGLARNGFAEKALGVYHDMRRYGFEPNDKTYACVLSACAQAKELELGIQIHGIVKQKSIDSVGFVATSLVHMYSQCGVIDDALQAFERANGRRTISTWNALIVGFARNGLSVQCLCYLMQMHKEGIRPDWISLLGALPACARIGDLKHGTEIHGRILRALSHCHPFLASSLVYMYGKCGQIRDAENVFCRTSHKCGVLYGSMMNGYAVNRLADKAIELMKQMEELEMKPNHVTFVGILSACRHARLPEEGKKYFHMMTVDYGLEPWAVHYYCMIDLMIRCDFVQEASDLMKKASFKHDVQSLQSLLSSAINHKNVQFGELLVEQLLEIQPPDICQLNYDVSY